MNAPMPVWNRNFRRSTDVVREFGNTEPSVAFLPTVVAELPRWSPRQIGSRWSDGHAVHRDPISGFYEERNPPMEGYALDVQAALLAQKRNNRSRYWLGVPLLLVGVYIFVRVMWP